MDARIFISHKHADKQIALTVAQFIKEKTANRVAVHDSSSAEFEGPRIGKNLNDELKNALAQADVVILIYTSEDEDWQYCMWECGLAIDPWDEHPTDVVVLQCGSASPKPFADTLRVDARDLESLTAFTQAFLTSADFFPNLKGKISEFNPEDRTLKKYAKELYDNLATVIPAPQAGQISDLTSSTFLRIELPPEAVDEIEAAQANDQLRVTMDALRDSGLIVENERATALFGFKIGRHTTIGKVLREWENAAHGEKALWFESLAHQISLAVLEKYPDGVPWAPYSSERKRSTIPYVGRSRRTASDAMEFDTYFIPVAPAPVKVLERMIPTSEAFHIRLDQRAASEFDLGNLIDQMENDQRTRIPVLGEGGRPQYIIHLSMIEKFMAQRARKGDSVADLTLQDIMAVEKMANMFASTYALVGPDATLGEATTAMTERDGCQDIFVTQDGLAESPMIGWLTNTMLGE